MNLYEQRVHNKIGGLIKLEHVVASSKTSARDIVRKANPKLVVRSATRILTMNVLMEQK